NITNEPVLLGIWSIAAASPCRSAGNAAYTSGTDIDGESWFNPPSIGADEYHAGSVTGSLAVAIAARYTGAAPGSKLDFRGLISGRGMAVRWEFGDGTVISNRLDVSHSWMTAGDYEVVLRAYNDTYPAGVAATLVIHIVQAPVCYVALDSTNPVPPYITWNT